MSESTVTESGSVAPRVLGPDAMTLYGRAGRSLRDKAWRTTTFGVSWTLGGERQAASDPVIYFGCRQRERVQRGGPWRLGFERARSVGLLRRMHASGFRGGGYTAVSRLGSRFASVAHSVRRRRTRPRARFGYPESTARSPICPDQAIQSRLHRDPANLHTRAQEPEIHKSAIGIVRCPRLRR